MGAAARKATGERRVTAVFIITSIQGEAPASMAAKNDHSAENDYGLARVWGKPESHEDGP